MAQEVFGKTIDILDKNGNTKKVIVREIAEHHIVQDMGCIPSPGDWLDCMNCVTWMGGKQNKFIGREEVFQSIQKEGKKERRNHDRGFWQAR